ALRGNAEVVAPTVAVISANWSTRLQIQETPPHAIGRQIKPAVAADAQGGANRDGFHLAGVDVARDVLSAPRARLIDLRTATAGNVCPRCDGVLESYPALEVGHIFKLG